MDDPGRRRPAWAALANAQARDLSRALARAGPRLPALSRKPR